MITRNMMAGGSGVPAVFEFKYTVTTNASGSSDRKSALPINLYGQTGVEISVDWGDGNTSVLKPSDYTASSSLASVHEYASAGTYQITASSSNWSNAYLLSCYADATISSANNANQPVYWWRRTLKSVDSPLPPVKGVMRLASASATSMTASDNDLGFLFHRCEKMTSIPANLFENAGHIEEFNSTFYNCIVLPSIPAGLFDPCVSALNFSDCFRYCLALTSIPVSFFKYCTAATNMYNVFRFCNKVPSVPADLFLYNTHVTNLGGAFSKCDALKNFTLCIGSPNVATVTDFIVNASGVTRIVCVPANSTTYNSFNSYKNTSNNVTVSTSNADCGIEEEVDDGTWQFTVNTQATTSGEKKAGVPFNLYGQTGIELTVDWGDNTTSILTPSDYAENDSRASVHEYATAGTYTITITSNDWEDVYFYTTDYNIEELNNKNSSLYYFKQTLTNVNTKLPQLKGSYSLDDNMFDPYMVDGLADLFFNCNKLTSIPEGLFENNTSVTTFYECFSNCSSLTLIPKLFGNHTEIVDFTYCFTGCSSLTSISERLFESIDALSFNGCFNGCSLVSIPEGLFDNCTSAEDFSGCFSGCSITSIPSGLFDNCTSAEDFSSCFSGCSSLTSIPSGLFAKNTAVTNFGYCFYGCSSLQSIPSGLFGSNTAVTDFGYCFRNCSSLQSIPSGLFDKNTRVTNFSSCFSGCTNLLNFHLKMGSSSVTNFSSFIPNASNVDRILCVPANSTTYTNASSFVNSSNGVIVSTDFIECSEAWEFTIDTEATTVGAKKTAIPFYLYGQDGITLFVDWGDNTASTLTSANYTSSNQSSSIHEYESPGQYTISIVINNWENVYITTSGGASSGSYQAPLYWWRNTLISVQPLPKIKGSRYISNIGAFSYSDKDNDLNSIFYKCSSLQSIPSGLFDKNTAVTDFSKCFYECSSLASIPAGLFDKNTAVTNFSNCFYQCSSLQSIPSGLFASNTAVTNFSNCFERCSSLASIPSGLFDNCTLVTNFGEIFKLCTSLQFIPSGLFDHNTAIINLYGCFWGTSITSIPSELFDHNTAVTSFYNCFYDCTSLASIPSGLFDKNTAVTSFENCFCGCSSIASIPSGLFDKNTEVTSFYQCFYSCSIISIPSGLFDNNTKVTSFDSTFNGCTSLASIPTKLFDKNTKVTSFNGCFYGCTNLLNFHLKIGSSSVTNFNAFISDASNVDRVLCVPANSTTYTKASSYANNSNNIIVSTDIIDCAEAWEFTINTEAKTTGEKKTGIPFNLYNQSGIQLTVDWGDNTTSTLTSADYAQDNATASVHEYAAAGEYTVTIVSNNWENTYLLIVDDWLGSTKTYTHEVGLYYFQTSLIKVNTALPTLKGIMHKEPDYTTYTINKNFSYGFCSCEKLKSIPYNLFYNNPSSTNFYMCFYRCSSLISIPAGLFDRNTAVTNFGDCFGSCSSLKSIPAGLFDRNTAVTNFNNCFTICGILTIPSGLFANNTEVTDFSNCFMSCSSLLSIPSDLFANNTKVTSFSQCFNGCDSITSIPSGLFANNTKVTDFNTCFDHCNSLTHIPSDLFANNTKVTTFHYCFGRCPALTSIPSGLFDNNTAVTNFSMCFINCTSLSFVPSGLFANNTAVTTFSQCFEKCSNLRSFHLKIGSPNVSYFNYLIYDTSSSTECTLCVPANSTSYNAANTEAQSYNIIVTTDYTECAETFEFTINTEATETGEKTTGIPFNLYGQTGVQLTVDWGDNTTSTLTPSNYTSSDSTASLHEYATAGEYTVTIVSNNWKNTYIFTASSISSYTNVNSALYWFRRTLTSIDSRLPKVKGISHSNPSTTTNNSLKYLFYEAAKLISIPSGLFDYNTAVTDFTSCFSGCSSIATIPSGLFDYNPAVTDFSQCFLNCSSLQSIPVGMFNKNTSVTNFYRCFYGCSSLELIPEGLFANNITVTSFQGCFYGCQSLENFKLVISSKLVSDFDTFVSSTSNVTRIVCVPANSTTYTTLSNYAQTGSNVNNITVSTTDANCIQTFEYTIDTEATTANAKIATVPLQLSSNSSSYSKLMIDWGDGNGVELTSSEITIENLTHTYSSSGEYQITVGTSNWLDYVFLISSSNSCTSLLQTFKETVISIDGAIPQITPSSSYYINTLNYWFFNCKHLITCSSHTFDNFSNVTSAINVFQNCTSLTTIPSGLFGSNTAITSFTRCFQNCTSLASIPSELFDSNTAVTTFSYCFYGCTSLASIPSGLFDSNTAVTTFSNCFRGCSSLQSIPSGLFDSNTAVTSFEYCFYECTSLTTIPSGLFDKNTEVTTFYACFYGCTSLQSIPAGLFDKNTAVTSFSNCFRGCTSLASIPEGLFDKNTAVTTFLSCFYDCTSLASIPSGLFSTNTAATAFGYCFHNCTSLASIPSGLFSTNTAVTNFYSCFNNCTQLTDFTLNIGSSLVTSATSFVTLKSGTTRTINVPANSATYTAFSNVASSLGLTIVGV